MIEGVLGTRGSIGLIRCGDMVIEAGQRSATPALLGPALAICATPLGIVPRLTSCDSVLYPARVRGRADAHWVRCDLNACIHR